MTWPHSWEGVYDYPCRPFDSANRLGAFWACTLFLSFPILGGERSTQYGYCYDGGGVREWDSQHLARVDKVLLSVFRTYLLVVFMTEVTVGV